MAKNVWNQRFWHSYYNETDPAAREDMFHDWLDPLPEAPPLLFGAFNNS